MKMRKPVALLLCGLLVLALAGCGNPNAGLLGNLYENVMTIDGTEIPSGIYVTIQYNAFTTAQSLVEEPEAEVSAFLKQEIDGVRVSDWIHNETMQNCRKYVAVNRLVREKEITISEENSQYLQQTMSYFNATETTVRRYEYNGIGYNSMLKVLANSMLEDQLFTELYGPEGGMAPSDEELKKQYGEQNAHTRYVMIPVNNINTSEDMSAEVQPIADKMVERLESGEDFDAVAAESLEEAYAIIERSFDETTVESSISDSYTNYTPADYETYTKEYLDTLKNQAEGDFGSYNMGSIILVYEKIPTFADDEAFQGMRDTVVKALCQEDFDSYLASIYNEYAVEEEFGAIRYFSPSKIITSL